MEYSSQGEPCVRCQDRELKFVESVNTNKPLVRLARAFPQILDISCAAETGVELATSTNRSSVRAFVASALKTFDNKYCSIQRSQGMRRANLLPALDVLLQEFWRTHNAAPSTFAERPPVPYAHYSFDTCPLSCGTGARPFLTPEELVASQSIQTEFLPECYAFSKSLGSVESPLFRCSQVMQSANLCLTTTTPEELVASIRWFLQPLRLLRVNVAEIALTLLLSLRFTGLVFDEVSWTLVCLDL